MRTTSGAGTIAQWSVQSLGYSQALGAGEEHLVSIFGFLKIIFVGMHVLRREGAQDNQGQPTRVSPPSAVWVLGF